MTASCPSDCASSWIAALAQNRVGILRRAALFPAFSVNVLPMTDCDGATYSLGGSVNQSSSMATSTLAVSCRCCGLRLRAHVTEISGAFCRLYSLGAHGTVRR